MNRLYAAADRAVAVVENGKVELTLQERGARCLAVDPKDPDTVYVGTSDEGLFRSSDGGGSWERLSVVVHPRITSVAVSPIDGAIYAGTEPSSLFVNRDHGESWHELEGLKNLPSAPTWSFPPRPWTSHVRSIALSFEDPDLIVAGIELGGVVRSEDGGETWQDQRPGPTPTATPWPRTPPPQTPFMRPRAAGSPRARTSGRAGLRPIRGSSTVTSGASQRIERILLSSTSPQLLGRARHMGAAFRMLRSTDVVRWDGGKPLLIA